MSNRARTRGNMPASRATRSLSCDASCAIGWFTANRSCKCNYCDWVIGAHACRDYFDRDYFDRDCRGHAFLGYGRRARLQHCEPP